MTYRDGTPGTGTLAAPGPARPLNWYRHMENGASAYGFVEWSSRQQDCAAEPAGFKRRRRQYAAVAAAMGRFRCRWMRQAAGSAGLLRSRR